MAASVQIDQQLALIVSPQISNVQVDQLLLLAVEVNQVNITMTLVDTSNTPLPYAWVRFLLRNLQGRVPTASGFSGGVTVCETKLDAYPNSVGLVSQLLWPNNSISPAGTWYEVQLWNLGRVISRGNYYLNSVGDLSNFTQIGPPSEPPIVD